MRTRKAVVAVALAVVPLALAAPQAHADTFFGAVLYHGSSHLDSISVNGHNNDQCYNTDSHDQLATNATMSAGSIDFLVFKGAGCSASAQSKYIPANGVNTSIGFSPGSYLFSTGD